jgi:MoaA/NifB/PqqE/SkfB family radical SAM enzyme
VVSRQRWTTPRSTARGYALRCRETPDKVIIPARSEMAGSVGERMSNDFSIMNSWKCLLYKREAEAILAGKFLPPVVVHIYPTNFCPFRCSFCIMQSEHERQSLLSRHVFTELVRSANRMGVKSLHVSGGGEPTLFPWLSDVDDFDGLRVLSTNGSMLTPSKCDLFDRVRVSLNAGTAETHKVVCGTGEWEHILSNVRECLKSCPKTKLGLGFVVAPSNWHEIPDFLALADMLEVAFVHIRPAYFPPGPDNDALIKMMGRVQELVKENTPKGLEVLFSTSKFQGYWGKREYQQCLASPLSAVVAATGELLVCQDRLDLRFGNLNEKRLEDVWGGEEHLAAIAKIDLDKCPRCVNNAHNEVIEKVFQKNLICQELL